MASANDLAIASPSPVPPKRRVIRPTPPKHKTRRGSTAAVAVSCPGLVEAGGLKMRLFDQPDDLKLFGSGISHSSSPPVPLALFFEQAVFQGQFGHDFLWNEGRCIDGVNREKG